MRNMARKPRVICRTKRAAAWNKKNALELQEARAWLQIAGGLAASGLYNEYGVEHVADRMLAAWRERFAPMYEEGTRE